MLKLFVVGCTSTSFLSGCSCWAFLVVACVSSVSCVVSSVSSSLSSLSSLLLISGCWMLLVVAGWMLLVVAGCCWLAWAVKSCSLCRPLFGLGEGVAFGEGSGCSLLFPPGVCCVGLAGAGVVTLRGVVNANVEVAELDDDDEVADLDDGVVLDDVVCWIGLSPCVRGRGMWNSLLTMAINA